VAPGPSQWHESNWETELKGMTEMEGEVR
jgi:hypothetical protein